jgi:hypothetical protein
MNCGPGRTFVPSGHWVRKHSDGDWGASQDVAAVQALVVPVLLWGPSVSVSLPVLFILSGPWHGDVEDTSRLMPGLGASVCNCAASIHVPR